MIRVNGKELEWEEGMNVNRMLEKMNYTYSMIIVKVNGKVIKKDQWNDYTIPDKADVKAIHVFGGG